MLIARNILINFILRTSEEIERPTQTHTHDAEQYHCTYPRLHFLFVLSNLIGISHRNQSQYQAKKENRHHEIINTQMPKMHEVKTKNKKPKQNKTNLEHRCEQTANAKQSVVCLFVSRQINEYK